MCIFIGEVADGVWQEGAFAPGELRRTVKRAVRENFSESGLRIRSPVGA